MKRTLPTVQGDGSSRRGHGAHDRGKPRERPLPPLERIALDRAVVAVAHINQAATATRLAAQLCAAFVRERVAVAALVSIDSPAGAHEAELALSALLAAGASPAVLFRRPDKDPQHALTHALEQLGEAEWIVACGNTLPQLVRPYFTVVVTGHRRDLTSAESVVLQAELEVTSPGDELATLLARRLHAQWAERRAPNY